MLNHLDALLTHLGTGRWTVLHMIVLAYSSVLIVPHAFGGALLAPRLDFSCRAPAETTTTTTTNNNNNFSLLHQATNSSSSLASFSTQDECKYRIDTPEGVQIEDCLEFNFDNSTFTSTFTSQYNLACGQAYLQTSFQSIYMLGNFLGAPVNGFLSDKYSRKRTVMLGYVALIALGLVSAWFPSLSLILVARLCMGVLHSFSSYSSVILLMEVLEPKRRTLAAFGLYSVWGVTGMLYGGLGYLIRDWRMLQTVATLPGLLILPALWLIDESPLWLIVNGRPQEALEIFSKMARWHGVELPAEAEMKKLVEEQTAEVRNITPNHSSVWSVMKSVVGNGVILFKTPRLRTITLCIYFNYLVVGTVYYGLSLSGASVSDDPYVYLVLSGLMELPAYLFSGYIVQYFGRKSSLSSFFLIAAAVLLALAFTPAAYSTTVLVLAMAGKLAITVGFQMVIFFSGELFPTEVRSRGVSTAFMMSCVGSTVAPFLTDLVGSMYPWAPFVIFGTGALLAGAGTFLLPETRGQGLPDTVANLEARQTKKSDMILASQV